MRVGRGLCSIATLASCLVRVRCFTASASPAQAAFKVLAERSVHEQIVKKSKFIAHAQSVRSFEEAKEFIASVSDGKANHNCWAYRDPNCERSSDDGEPSSTAGKPILSAIIGCDLQHTCCVVTRHFGGIKLGTGGLVRAYGSTAKMCMQNAPTKMVVPSERLSWQVSLEDVPAVLAVCKAGRHSIESQDFGLSSVEIKVLVEAPQKDELTEKLSSATQGRATLLAAERVTDIQW